MRQIAVVTIAMAVSAGALHAQRGQRLGGQGRDALVEQVIQQFVMRYERMAALTPDQSEQFRTAVIKNFQARKDQQQREREALQALEFQMRPGVAANADSVTRLIDALTAARQAEIDQSKAEQREYAAFLNPVQRGQLVIQWEQLMNRIQQAIRDRQQARAQGPGTPN